MRYQALARLAEHTKVAALLDRFGLRERISELVRVTIDESEREKWLAIRKDYDACRHSIRRLVADAPRGSSDKPTWMISSLATIGSLKLEGMVSLAARLSNLRPFAVHPVRDVWSLRYHELFGIQDFLFLDDYRKQAIAVSRDFEGFARGNPTVGDLISLQFHGVSVGRIALSNILTRRKFEKFDIRRPETLAELVQELTAVQNTVASAERMFDARPPTSAFILEKGVSPMAEVAGVCLAKGVPLIQYVGSQNVSELVFKRYSQSNAFQHPFSLDTTTWNELLNTPSKHEEENEIMTEFERAYRDGTWFNRKFLHHKKEIKPSEAVRKQLGLDPAKKTAVIFSHVLWDATFFYGVGLFEDYETWLLASVRSACANPSVNWIIKLHPDLVWKLKYENYSGDLRDVIAIRSEVGTLPDHVKLVLPDTDISSFSFFEITDYCITVRGTIGIEMACHGVPVITAGTGRYSGMGFTIDSASSSEYLDRLANIQTQPSMSREQTQLARRFAYTLFKRRPWPMKSFEVVRMPIQNTGHPLEHNVIPHVHSFADLAVTDDFKALSAWVLSAKIDFLS